MKQLRAAFIATLFAVFATGCATQAPTLNFTPKDVLPAKNKVQAELKSISVSVAKEDERLGETQVGFFGNQYEQTFRTNFKESIEEALAKSAVFNDLADRKVSLTAKVMKFETPGMSVSFETHMIVRYELFDRANGQLVFRRDVESRGSVPFDYAFLGAIRFTEARNVAVRQNLMQFVNSLEEVKFTTAAAK